MMWKAINTAPGNRGQWAVADATYRSHAVLSDPAEQARQGHMTKQEAHGIAVRMNDQDRARRAAIRARQAEQREQRPTGRLVRLERMLGDALYPRGRR